MKRALILTIALCLFLPQVSFSGQNEFPELLMRSTFMITDGKTLGTVFILGRPDPVAPDRVYYCLFTATHVFDSFPGEMATLKLRKFENGAFSTLDYNLKIRDGNKPLWISHPKADVAAMNVSLPRDCDLKIISTDLLANDKMLTDFEVHPGDEVMVFGFPLGFRSDPGFFPILRSAKIAGYPLTPVGSTVTFLIDFEIFPGNSGGPVLFYDTNRFYNGFVNIGSVHFLMGVVTQEVAPTNVTEFIDETIIKKTKLKLGVAVHAHFVKELLDKIPIPR